MLRHVIAVQAPASQGVLDCRKKFRRDVNPLCLHPPDPGTVLHQRGIECIRLPRSTLRNRRVAIAWHSSSRNGTVQADDHESHAASHSHCDHEDGDDDHEDCDHKEHEHLHSDSCSESQVGGNSYSHGADEDSHGHAHSHNEVHHHEQDHLHGQHGHTHGNAGNLKADEDHHGHAHSHNEAHHHEHDHHHSHHGHTHGNAGNLNGLQTLLQRVSQLLGLGFLADLLRDNLQACLASLALLLLGAAAPFVLPKSIGATVQTALVLPALPLTGVPAVLDATIDVAGGRINIHVLMAVAAFASVFMGNALEGGLLLAMFSLSHQAEDYFTQKALGDIKALKESNPEFALVLEPFDVAVPPPLSALVYKTTPVNLVEVGSYIFVKAGETVPVDGEVWQGRAMVTVEHLTGEAQPVEKVVGEDVPGGARSLDGVMIVKATKKWKDSTVARIMKLTEEAQLNRPILQRWLDDFGERYSQAVVAMSVAVALLGPLLFKWPFLSSPGVRGSVYRALGLMVAASPCALAVAPLAYATAVSACANKGILLKGGEALDALARCDTIAFDKTGTLTTGDLVCKAIEPLYGHCEEQSNSTANSCCSPDCEKEALAVAVAMERGATHPIARAVVEHSEGMKLPGVVVDNFYTIPGEGLVANVTQSQSGSGPSQALLGSLEYVASSSKTSSQSSKIRQAAKASSFGSELVQAVLSVNNKVTLFHFEDKLRVHAADVVHSLKGNSGLRLLMLTGDHAASAQRVAKAVGIDEVYFGLKPEDKLHQVKILSRQSAQGLGGLIMVGDGINDAPALAAASVGIVLAKRASATAVAVADVLLLQDALDGVSFVIAKARQTDTLVKQSVALALSCIFMASLPSILGVLPLWLTVLLHEGGTLLVCINSARAFNDPTIPWDWRERLSKIVNKTFTTLVLWLRRADSEPAIKTATATAPVN